MRNKTIVIDRDSAVSVTERRSGCLATTKADTREAGTDVKGIGVFADAHHLEGGGLMSKAYLHISMVAEVVLRRERGTEQRDQGRGVEKFSMCRRTQSILIRQVMVLCLSSGSVILDSSHPVFTSPWLLVILAPWLKVSKSPRAEMPEGRSLYL